MRRIIQTKSYRRLYWKISIVNSTLNVRRWLLYRIKQGMDGIYQVFTIHVDGYMVEILWDYCSSWNVLEHFKNLHEKRVILNFQE